MSEPREGAVADATGKPHRIHLSRIALIGVAVGAGIAGGLIGRLVPSPTRPQSRLQSRPIVQIVRLQAGLPSLADMIGGLCPSIAVIVPRAAQPSNELGNSAAADAMNPLSAVVVSSDGWLLTSSAVPDRGDLDVLMGDGRRMPIAEVRRDPVSGLAIVKIDGEGVQPVALNDQLTTRIGDFGLGLQTLGKGCSAETAMIGSDFVADGGGQTGYVRLQGGAGDWPDGTAFFGSDGKMLGIANANEQGELIPSALASVITDELIRNSLSPTAEFGFRATDFTAALSSRLGNARSRGAGVALVQPKSSAARAGLQAGDIVLAVNGAPVSSASELGRALDAAGGKASLTISRGSNGLVLTIVRA